jgi:hypothetical protein
MNATENARQSGTPFISPEAVVGIGITIAELGLLCLLLSWAEYMRAVPAIALIWLAPAVVLLVSGALTAVVGWSRGRQPR